jgi:tetratricopeptide (TPR) repeat protein
MTERVWTSIVALTAFVLAAAVLQARDAPGSDREEADRLLYVRSGALASRVFLSFDAIAADLYWIRAIQYDGRQRRSTRTVGQFNLLEPLVDLAVTLDPKFNIPYRFGAILIALEPPNGPGRPDRAIALLEKGLQANPERWQYAHDIGFVHYWYTGRFDEAARWFTRAGAMSGAPRWLGPLAAVTLARGGDREGARRLLVELAATSDGYIRRSAERGLAQLQALDDLDRLETVLRDQFARTGEYPAALIELPTPTPPAALVDPTGRPYAYNATSGAVGLAPDSPLSPLPRTLGRR